MRPQAKRPGQGILARASTKETGATHNPDTIGVSTAKVNAHRKRAQQRPFYHCSPRPVQKHIPLIGRGTTRAVGWSVVQFNVLLGWLTQARQVILKARHECALAGGKPAIEARSRYSAEQRAKRRRSTPEEISKEGSRWYWAAWREFKWPETVTLVTTRRASLLAAWGSTKQANRDALRAALIEEVFTEPVRLGDEEFPPPVRDWEFARFADGSDELKVVIDTRWVSETEKGRFDMIPPLPRGATEAALMLFAFGAQYSDIRKKSAWVEVAKLCHWVGIPSNLKPYHAKRKLVEAMVRVNEYLGNWVNHVLDHTDDTENVSFRKLNMPYRFALEFYTEEDGTSYVHVAVGNWLAYEKPESEGERPPRSLAEYARRKQPTKRPAKPKTYWDMVKEAERKMSNG